ncbi:uncharacterized protein LOC124887737 [Capsicum annuum]|uniref:uncharacterized protein LOC124887737 n=1 Tax=Capsicum annuum TaxID=4072 RepID=UPI001FB157EF|nr:uncharacterized protein LOC124887737 [Capsicum annuum]
MNSSPPPYTNTPASTPPDLPDKRTTMEEDAPEKPSFRSVPQGGKEKTSSLQCRKNQRRRHFGRCNSEGMALINRGVRIKKRTIQEESKLGSWSDEDETKEEIEATNMYFMAKGESSKEYACKRYKKEIWVIDCKFYREIIEKKENSCALTKIDGGSIRFGDNGRGNVIGVGSVKLSSSCEFTEVYLVDGLKHNFLNISQLCDAGF